MIDKKRLDNVEIKVKEIWNDDKGEKNGESETKREWDRKQHMIPTVTTAKKSRAINANE